MSPDSALARLQGQFVAAVLAAPGAEAAAAAALAPLLKPGRATPAEMLDIYRRNARENFAAALAAGYPALQGILGPGEFRAMAWAYQRRHPSPSGNLQAVGESLPAFLEATLGATDRVPLADLARLEWAVQGVSFAADDPHPLDLAALAAIPPEQHGLLRFRLSAAVVLLRTRHPVFALWRQQRGDDGGPVPEPGPPGNAGAERLLVCRRDRGAEVHRLPAGEFAWLEALGEGAILETALERGLQADPRLDLPALLVRWCRAGVISQVTRPAVPGVRD